MPLHTHRVLLPLAQVCLSNIHLTVEQLEVACALLKHNLICERVLLTNNAIPAEGAYFISEMLKVNRALRSLTLLANTIGDVGIALIADALTTNKTLRELDVSRNYIRREVRVTARKRERREGGFYVVPTTAGVLSWSKVQPTAHDARCCRCVLTGCNGNGGKGSFLAV